MNGDAVPYGGSPSPKSALRPGALPKSRSSAGKLMSRRPPSYKSRILAISCPAPFPTPPPSYHAFYCYNGASSQVDARPKTTC